MAHPPVISQAQHAATVEWVYSFMAVGDSLDCRRWVEDYFTTDADFIQPDQPPVKGHDRIIEVMNVQQGLLQSLRHTIRRVDVLHDRVYVEAAVEWVVQGDPELRTIKGRGMGVLDKKVDEDRLSRFDVFADFSKLKQRLLEVHSSP